VWIIFVGVVSYLKLIISKLMMAEGHTALFWFGVATQVRQNDRFVSSTHIQ